jgi:choline monooxygenase
MCYRFEEPLHRFQNMIIDRMVGIDRAPVGDDDTMTPMFVSVGSRRAHHSPAVSTR